MRARACMRTHAHVHTHTHTPNELEFGTSESQKAIEEGQREEMVGQEPLSRGFLLSVSKGRELGTSSNANPLPSTFSKTKGSSFQTGLMELVVGDSLVR